jgi:thiamine kinase-like enzyme
MERLGRALGLQPAGATGLLAVVANILAMYHLVARMRARDKVRVIAFAACAAFVFGDHLAFTSNFQPTLLPAVMLGKLAGGAVAFLFACWLSVPAAERLEQEDERHDVLALLAHTPLLRERLERITITRLEGGLTNRNYRLDVDDESYVLRIARPHAELLDIDRDREAACTRAGAEAGVAPEVLTYLPEHITLIRRYAPGASLTAAALHDSETLQRVVEALRRTHAQPAPAEAENFSPFEKVERYYQRARERHVPLSPETEGALQLLRETLQSQLQPEGPPCLCHNDLLPSNLMDDGLNVQMIDWEYAGRGDRFFDLANLAANAQFDEAQERLLLESYFGQVRPEDLLRLRRMRLVSDLREAMWSYLQSAISDLHGPQFYLDRGREHLERFRRGAAALRE